MGPRAGQSKKCSQLTRRPQNYEQDHQNGEDLESYADDGPQALDLAAVQRGFAQQVLEPVVEEDADQQNSQNDGETDERFVNRIALFGADENVPIAVGRGELLLVVGPEGQGTGYFSLAGAAFDGVEQG